MTREGREGGEAGGQARGAAHKMEGPRSPTRPHAAPRRSHAAPRSPTQPMRVAACGSGVAGVGGWGPKRGVVGFCCERMVRQGVLGSECRGTGGQEEGDGLGHKEVVMRSGVLFWEVGLWTPILPLRLTGVTERPAVMSERLQG